MELSRIFSLLGGAVAPGARQLLEESSAARSYEKGAILHDGSTGLHRAFTAADQKARCGPIRSRKRGGS